MYKLTSKLRQKFLEYTYAAADSAEDLRFLLENFNVEIDVDLSDKSLVMLEGLYWQFRDGKLEWSDSFGTIDDFANLLCRYMSQCILHHTSAEWVQTKEKNHLFGQPCLDGFGNAEWERIYPASLGMQLGTLRKTNPTFPGAKTRTVLAEQLRKAKKIQAKRQQAHGGGRS